MSLLRPGRRFENDRPGDRNTRTPAAKIRQEQALARRLRADLRRGPSGTGFDRKADHWSVRERATGEPAPAPDRLRGAGGRTSVLT